jgi:hypothetical protein
MNHTRFLRGRSGIKAVGETGSGAYILTGKLAESKRGEQRSFAASTCENEWDEASGTKAA